MGGNGYCSQGSNDQCAHHLRRTHKHVLQSHWRTYLEGRTHRFSLRTERTATPHKREHLGPIHQEIEHQAGRYQHSHTRAQSGSHHT